MANLFKLNKLAPLPPSATITHRSGERFARWVDAAGVDQRAKVVETVNGLRIVTRPGKFWYGKIKIATGWKRVKLYTDKAASMKRLADLQAEADQRDCRIITSATERLKLPISDLAKQYGNSLEAENRDPDHVRISGWMLNRLIAAAGWKSFRDITPDSIQAAIPGLAGTTSYATSSSSARRRSRDGQRRKVNRIRYHASNKSTRRTPNGNVSDGPVLTRR